MYRVLGLLQNAWNSALSGFSAISLLETGKLSVSIFDIRAFVLLGLYIKGFRLYVQGLGGFVCLDF